MNQYASYASHSGIRPKSTAEVGRVVSFLCFPLTPLREMRTLFSSAKRILALM